MSQRMTKRADGRFKTTFTHEGTRHSAYGRTQAEAKQQVKEARTRLDAGAPVRDASRTLADWLSEWQETFLKSSDRARSTKVLYDGADPCSCGTRDRCSAAGPAQAR
jgi:integrase